MIPRKKRRMIIIISIVIVLLILLIGFALVYINTDMFKSNKTLFKKYLGKNVDNIGVIYNDVSNKTDYEKSLEQNKYTTNTQINVNYTENIGTTQESTDNAFNQLKIVADGQVDKINQYEYQKMNLYNGDNSILGLEYIKDNNTYGLRFSDLFKQFLLVDNANLQELSKKLGATEEQVENIPNEISLNLIPIDQLKFNNEEKKNLSDRYTKIIEENIGENKQNFSKQKGTTIQIDGKNVQVNAYIVTLTKEQLNNLYLKILEQLKDDDIILGKLDIIQTELDNTMQIFNPNGETQNLRDSFINEIDSIITEINLTNIGQNETKIIVYENMKNTVRTLIQTQEYELSLDYLITNQETYMEYKSVNISENSEQTISVKKLSDSTEVKWENLEENNASQVSLKENKKIDGNNMNKSIVIQYEDSSNRIEADIDQKVQLANQFEDQIILGEDNSIKLNDLEQEELESLLSTVFSGVTTKVINLQSEINMDDISQALINSQLVEGDNTLYSTGVTDSERSRYNSQFEILKGNNLKSDRILSIIDAIEDYISNLEVVSNTELRIGLSENGKDEQMITTLKNFIEKNKNLEYNVDVEYNLTTGLIDGLILIINE